jgi:hypothetical protein
MNPSASLTSEGSWFARFMASGYGRLARIAFGIVVVLVGAVAISGPVGLAIAAFGLIPLGAGAFNLCPVAPAWGGHFFGARYCPRPVSTEEDSR